MFGDQDQQLEEMLMAGAHLFGIVLPGVFRRSCLSLSLEDRQYYNGFLVRVANHLQEAVRQSTPAPAVESSRHFSLPSRSSKPTDSEVEAQAHIFCAHFVIEEFLLRNAQKGGIAKDLRQNILPFFVKWLNTMSCYRVSIREWLDALGLVCAQRKSSLSQLFHKVKTAPPVLAISWQDHSKSFCDSEIFNAYFTAAMQKDFLSSKDYQWAAVDLSRVRAALTSFSREAFRKTDDMDYFQRVYSKVLSLLELCSFTIFTSEPRETKLIQEYVNFYRELARLYWSLHATVIDSMTAPPSPVRQVYIKMFSGSIISVIAGRELNFALPGIQIPTPPPPYHTTTCPICHKQYFDRYRGAECSKCGYYSCIKCQLPQVESSQKVICRTCDNSHSRGLNNPIVLKADAQYCEDCGQSLLTSREIEVHNCPQSRHRIQIQQSLATSAVVVRSPITSPRPAPPVNTCKPRTPSPTPGLELCDCGEWLTPESREWHSCVAPSHTAHGVSRQRSFTLPANPLSASIEFCSRCFIIKRQKIPSIFTCDCGSDLCAECNSTHLCWQDKLSAFLNPCA